MSFGIVSVDQLPGIWPKCLPLLDEACHRNGDIDTPDDIFVLLKNHRKYMWLYIRNHEVTGLVLTTIEQYPAKRVCSLDICTGTDLDEWINNLPTIEKWAKENGCAEMFFMARIGYERKLADFNYRKTHIFLQKDLSE